jgi:serine/threonine-protein kinase
MAEVQQILCPICHKPNLRRANFCAYCGQDVVLNNDGPLRFKITEIIKEGGQGAVYRAVAVDKDGQPQGRPIYAIKEMLDRFTNPKEHDEALDRFEHEANLLKRLRHERIPRIYADFKDEGRQYLAMDFVEGQDLEEVIKRNRTIPEDQALKWADEICDVLEYLHSQKPEPIIFRDMKPSNVMIEPDGNVKLIDFGIAKVFQQAQRGTQIGTPGYAPPEQYQGLATPSSDIYALAATLHHALTGRDPRDEPPFSFPPVYGLKPTIS